MSYSYFGGKYNPDVNPENEAEIRACFQDEAEFELFRTGKDYATWFSQRYRCRI